MTTHDTRTFARFIVAGCVNTLFGLAVYSVALLIGADIWLALLTGMLMGVAFNFFSLGGYAFRDLSSKRLPRFIACYMAVYLLNLGAIHLLRQWVSSPMWIQLLLTPIMALLSYTLMSRWVFR